MILLKLGESLGGGGEEDPPASWHPLYANLWPHQKRNRIENGIRNTHSKLVYKSVKKITKTTTILNETEPIFFWNSECFDLNFVISNHMSKFEPPRKTKK